jgi:uncharacterized protein (UPF0276 family)
VKVARLYHLSRVLETYRVVQHGVSLAIGGPSDPDRDYLRRLARLLAQVRSPWLSDHFCWGGVPGANLHDLLPLPFTAGAVRRVSERARLVQDFLEVRLALENTSSYLQFRSSSMPEWEFVSEVAERADIGLLFDVNNVYVSAKNHDLDPYEFVRNVPHHRIVQIHLAGHEPRQADHHSRRPPWRSVWDLCETIRLAGSVSTLIDWDHAIRSRLAAAEGRSVRDARSAGQRLAGCSRRRSTHAPLRRCDWRSHGAGSKACDSRRTSRDDQA